MTEPERSAPTGDGASPRKLIKARPGNQYETPVVQEPLVQVELLTPGCGVSKPVVGTGPQIAPETVTSANGAPVGEDIDEHAIPSVTTLAALYIGEDPPSGRGFDPSATQLDATDGPIRVTVADEWRYSGGTHRV